MNMINIQTSLSDYIDNPISEQVAHAYRENIRRCTSFEDVLVKIGLAVSFLLWLGFIGSYILWFGVSSSLVGAVLLSTIVAFMVFILVVLQLAHWSLKKYPMKLEIDGQSALRGTIIEDFDEANIDDDFANCLNDTRGLLESINKLGRNPYVFEARLIRSMLIESAGQVSQEAKAR